MASRTKELLLSCGESIIQKRCLSWRFLIWAASDAFYSRPADGLQSLEDVRAVVFLAMRDLAIDGTSQVIQLQNTLEQALGAVLSLRNDFSPINRLPTETLSCIFDLVCAQYQDYGLTLPRNAARLAQVCGRWRSNVISTPLLWSTIHISQKTQPEFIALCLERSKDVPLEIILEMRGGLSAFISLPAYPRSISPHFPVSFINDIHQYDGTLRRSLDCELRPYPTVLLQVRTRVLQSPRSVGTDCIRRNIQTFSSSQPCVARVGRWSQYFGHH